MTNRVVEDSKVDEAPREQPPLSPFVRLARVHAFSAAADAMIAVALAGSLFFIDPEAARSRVLLYLLVTVAPFVLVGPFIGPALDRARGGRRAMIVLIQALRVVTAGVIAVYIESFWLFPVVFAHMVLGKSYAVAKAAIVPSTVQSDAELVEKNSRLAVLSAVAAVLGAAPAALLYALGGSAFTAGLAAITYVAAGLAATQLTNSVVDAPNHDALKLGGNIFLAASGMAVMRGVVGFMTFLFAFKFGGRADELDLSGVGRAVGAASRAAILELENEGRSLWRLGVLGACTAIGSFVGSFLAPRLRERYPEENLLLGGLGAAAIVCALTIWVGGLSGAAVLAAVVGFSAAASKVAFDAIVQRDAGHGNHGAAFARFESRFQLAWVFGALIPVIFPIGLRLGAFIMAIAAAFATASYFYGARSARAGNVSPLSASALRERLRPVREQVGPEDAEVVAAPDDDQITAPAANDKPPRATRSRSTRRERRATRRNKGAVEEAAPDSDDLLEVPGWIAATPPELRSIRPQPKRSGESSASGDVGGEMWDDHR